MEQYIIGLVLTSIFLSVVSNILVIGFVVKNRKTIDKKDKKEYTREDHYGKL